MQTHELKPQAQKLLDALKAGLESKDDLSVEAWGEKGATDTSINVHVCYLRKNIDIPIYTIRGVGYSLRKPDIEMPPQLREIFDLLQSKRLVRRSRIMCITGATVKSMHVAINRLRKVLRPHGYEIENVWGEGYRLK